VAIALFSPDAGTDPEFTQGGAERKTSSDTLCRYFIIIILINIINIIYKLICISQGN
jgi:hypothetical protein